MLQQRTAGLRKSQPFVRSINATLRTNLFKGEKCGLRWWEMIQRGTHFGIRNSTSDISLQQEGLMTTPIMTVEWLTCLERKTKHQNRQILLFLDNARSPTGGYETCVFATKHNIPFTAYGSGHYPDNQTEVGSLLGLKSHMKYDKLSLPKVAGVLEQSLWFTKMTQQMVMSKTLVLSVSIKMDNSLLPHSL